MHALPALLTHQPVIRFFREAVTMRTALIAAAFLSCVSLALALLNVNTLACLSGESTLVYPVYNKRGVITDYAQRCGTAHRGCTLRSDGSAYDCSPFMAPKGTLSQR